MKTLLATLLLLCTALLPLPAQDDSASPPNPIDTAMEKAMDKDPSTAGMIQAIAKAQTQWDALLNQNYKDLIAALDPQGQASLKSAQRAWIAYRDAEFEAINSIYDKMDGTMYRPMAASAHMQIVKDRALALKDRLDLVHEQ